MPRPEAVARAPGRVNLIGEHTDHQDGFVLPMAIGLATTVRARPRTDDVVRLESDAVHGAAEFRPGDEPCRVAPEWARGPAAVVALLRDAGLPAAGLDLGVATDLPLGAGLSSSAALHVAVALATIGAARASGAAVPPALGERATLAALCRDAEALGTGVRCGIMDPFVSLHGRRGAAILVDCRTFVVTEVALPAGRIAFVVADSGVRHAHTSGEYGKRRDECETAARVLGVKTLRDATPDLVHTHRAALGPVLLRRARHVVRENGRVGRAAASLASGDDEAFGRLLDRSHASLRDDFEVSCPELDALVEIAREVPGVLGSRMTGGGFGGSTVTAVRPGSAADLVAAFRDEGVRRLGRGVPSRIVAAAPGAEAMIGA